MKRKTALILITLCFALSLVFTFSTSAHAAAAWHFCKVRFAGLSGGKVQVYLYDASTNQKKWSFAYREDDEKEILAITLTAAANNQLVYAYFDNSLEKPIIYNIFLYNGDYKK